jgi:hypothetical protein
VNISTINLLNLGPKTIRSESAKATCNAKLKVFTNLIALKLKLIDAAKLLTKLLK